MKPFRMRSVTAIGAALAAAVPMLASTASAAVPTNPPQTSYIVPLPSVSALTPLTYKQWLTSTQEDWLLWTAKAYRHTSAHYRARHGLADYRRRYTLAQYRKRHPFIGQTCTDQSTPAPSKHTWLIVTAGDYKHASKWYRHHHTLAYYRKHHTLAAFVKHNLGGTITGTGCQAPTNPRDPIGTPTPPSPPAPPTDSQMDPVGSPTNPFVVPLSWTTLYPASTSTAPVDQALVPTLTAHGSDAVDITFPANWMSTPGSNPTRSVPCFAGPTISASDQADQFNVTITPLNPEAYTGSSIASAAVQILRNVTGVGAQAALNSPIGVYGSFDANNTTAQTGNSATFNSTTGGDEPSLLCLDAGINTTGQPVSFEISGLTFGDGMGAGQAPITGWPSAVGGTWLTPAHYAASAHAPSGTVAATLTKSGDHDFTMTTPPTFQPLSAMASTPCLVVPNTLTGALRGSISYPDAVDLGQNDGAAGANIFGMSDVSAPVPAVYSAAGWGYGSAETSQPAYRAQQPNNVDGSKSMVCMIGAAFLSPSSPHYGQDATFDFDGVAIGGQYLVGGGARPAQVGDQTLLSRSSWSPKDLVQTPDGALWAREDDASGNITKIDPATDQTTNYQVGVSGWPIHGLTLGSDGSLYTIAVDPATAEGATYSGSQVLRIDPATGTAAPVADFDSMPWDIKAGPDGDLYVIGGEQPGSGVPDYGNDVWRIDPNSGATTHVTTMSVTDSNGNRVAPHALTVAGGVLYAQIWADDRTSLYAIDTATGAVTNGISLPDLVDVAGQPDGTFLRGDSSGAVLRYAADGASSTALGSDVFGVNSTLIGSDGNLYVSSMSPGVIRIQQ